MEENYILSFILGLDAGLLLVILFQRRDKKSTKFKKGDKRTITLARLGGYSRWDRDGKRYEKK